MHKPIQMLGLFTCGSGRFVTQLTSQNAGPFQGCEARMGKSEDVFLFADAIPDEANVHDYALPCISRIKVNYKFRLETRQPFTSIAPSCTSHSIRATSMTASTLGHSPLEICDTAPGGCRGK